MNINNKKIIVLLTEHNFIDHMTPIIELLHTNSFDIKLIKVLHNYDYINDNNIKYLENQYPSLEIVDMFLNQNKFYMKLHDFYNVLNMKLSSSSFRPVKYFWYLLAGSIRRLITKVIIINDKNISEIFKEYEFKNTICVTDIGGEDEYYKKIRIELNKLNIKNITFTHAFSVFKNNLLLYSHLTKVTDKKEKIQNKFGNIIVLFNSLNVENIKIKYQCNVKVLPSLRYSTKWITKICESKDKFQIENKYKLKMVFMLSNEEYNIWKEEEYRTIQSILLQKDIFLVLKLHPRGMRNKNKYLKIKDNNLRIVTNEVSSSDLINWSDVVINISSGIIIEAIIKKKTIFYMKYLHCNSITVEDIPNVVHRVETRDQLLELIERFKYDKKEDTQNEIARIEFLKDYIGNDNFEENQKKYLSLFENL